MALAIIQCVDVSLPSKKSIINNLLINVTNIDINAYFFLEINVVILTEQIKL